MDFEPILLNGFEGREEALSKIKRFAHSLFPVMFYRTNDLIHSKRVLWHLEEAIPDIVSVYGNLFDVNFARTLAEVHDDVELVTGDVQLPYKEKMTRDELNVFAEEEDEAILKLIERFSSVANGFSYEELLVAAKEKKRLEAQFVSFFDKFDGAGEAWHEIWAGNSYFVLPAGGKDGKSGGYIRRLNEFFTKYPQMKPFFEKFPEYLPKPFDFKSAAEKGKIHTIESFGKDSGFELYEVWKKNIIKHEGVHNLIKQIEFDSKLGLVQVFWGDGKGKTTSALGTALRACGNGLKVYLIQFMKNGADSLPSDGQTPGEILSLKKFDNFNYKRFGTEGWIVKSPTEKQVDSSREALNFVKEILNSGDVDIVIADEILYAVQLGLLSEEDILELIESKPEKKELILTGSHKPFEKIFEKADLVSEIKKLKHPYDKGISARKGIEF